MPPSPRSHAFPPPRRLQSPSDPAPVLNRQPPPPPLKPPVASLLVGNPLPCFKESHPPLHYLRQTKQPPSFPSPSPSSTPASTPRRRRRPYPHPHSLLPSTSPAHTPRRSHGPQGRFLRIKGSSVGFLRGERGGGGKERGEGGEVAAKRGLCRALTGLGKGTFSSGHVRRMGLFCDLHEMGIRSWKCRRRVWLGEQHPLRLDGRCVVLER